MGGMTLGPRAKKKNESGRQGMLIPQSIKSHSAAWQPVCACLPFTEVQAGWEDRPSCSQVSPHQPVPFLHLVKQQLWWWPSLFYRSSKKRTGIICSVVTFSVVLGLEHQPRLPGPFSKDWACNCLLLQLL